MIQSVSLPVQHSSFLLRHIYVFIICLCKKKMPRIKFLGILKNVSKNKIYFCLKKKSNVSNILNICKVDFITQITEVCVLISCFFYSFISVCILFSFLFSCITYQFHRNNEHRTQKIVNPSLFIQLTKVQQNE